MKKVTVEKNVSRSKTIIVSASSSSRAAPTRWRYVPLFCPHVPFHIKVDDSK